MKIVWRQDEEYEELRRGLVWNLRKPARYPEVIARADTEQDVVDAVRLARKLGLQIKVRGTGHSRSASYLRDDGMLLDLSALTGFEIDTDARVAVVGPGVVAGVLNPALVEHDLFFPTAHEPEVGLGGYVMAGGIGWIAARHGLGCANLRAIDLVNAEGELIHSDDETNPEYIWAARGAGPGFFGVVTRFHLGLHPLPAAIRMSSYAYPMDIWEDVWAWAMEVTSELPRDVAANIGVPRKAGGPFSDDAPSVILNATAMSDSAEEAEAGIRILESCPYVDRATVRQVALERTVSELYTWADALQPSGLRYGLDNMWTDADADTLIPYLRDAVADVPNGLSNIHAHLWHHPQSVPNAALPEQGRMLVSLFGLWPSENDEATVMRWITEHLGRMEPIAKGVMIAEEELMLRPRTNILGDKLDRYLDIRAKLDPDGVFYTFPGLEEPAAVAAGMRSSERE